MHRPTNLRSGPRRTATALVLGIAALLLGGCAFPAPQSTAAPVPSGPLDTSRQLVVVTAADWSATAGTMQRFERESAAQQWRPIGEAFPIVLGTSGLAWGRGTHGDTPSAEYRKREGDGKSPAGIFALSAVFGYAPAAQAGPAARAMPYVQATTATECVDDSASTHYNRVLQRTGAAVDWNSAEHMRRDDDLYRLGIVVDHNTAPAQPGAGSCIFIHIWQGPGSTTDGCTAGDPANIAALAAWLDQARAPRLVQLPRDAYIAHMQAWRLPPLPMPPPVDRKAALTGG